MFIYFPLGKALENKQKELKIKEKKQIDPLEDLKPTKHLEKLKSTEGISRKDLENNEINKKLNKSNKLEENVNLLLYVWKHTYNFQQLKAMRCFGDSINNDKITISKANEKQGNLLKTILEFQDKTREKSIADKEKNSNSYKRVVNIYESWIESWFMRSIIFEWNDKIKKKGLKLFSTNISVFFLRLFSNWSEERDQSFSRNKF